MYSGFITPKRVVKRLGVHQRFDTAAYHMVAPYFGAATFPPLRDILHFEGVNGPDGVKSKLGIKLPDGVVADTSHMYDPGEHSGELPRLITSHYDQLVKALTGGDQTRAAFEASWLAHYLADGLTPAHHFPYDEKKEELFGEDSEISWLRKNWAWLGMKGVLSTHMFFEIGVASALLMAPIKTRLDEAKLAQAKKVGLLEFFRREAKDIAGLDLYSKFYRRGWNQKLAKTVRQVIAPRTIQLIGLVWLMAYLEAEKLMVSA